MKTPAEMLTDFGWLDVATLFRERMGGKLVAIRDNQGNGHGRLELLDEVQFSPAQVETQVETQVKPYRGKERI
jgi:hypothetical protein